MRYFRLSLIIMSFVALAAFVIPAFAEANATSYETSCSSFSGHATTDREYAVVEAELHSNNELLVFKVVHAHADDFSFDVSFDKQPTGTLIDYYVYSSNSSGTWDSQNYFGVTLECRPESHGNSGGNGPIAGNLLDGRINKSPDVDVAAPIAIYQDKDKNVTVYAIDPATGNGTQVLNWTWSAISGQGVPSGANLVLADITTNGLRIVFSRLTSGELQVNVYGAGNPYLVAWPPDNPDGLYHPTG